MSKRLIYEEDAIDAVAEGLKRTFVEYRDVAEKMLNKVPSVQPEPTRTFIELVVEYPHPELCTYKEYRGKPYYSIKYIENGETYIGYGTYNPEVLSKYLKEYFIASAQPETEERTAESAQNVPNDELITKKTAIDADALWNDLEILYVHNKGKVNWNDALLKIKNAPTIEVTQRWIPVTEALPKDIRPVIVTWKNNDPESYYQSIVGKHFIGVAHFKGGKWYWYSSTTEDYLAEYGRYDGEEFDEAIEVVAWMPLPEPHKGVWDEHKRNQNNETN